MVLEFYKVIYDSEAIRDYEEKKENLGLNFVEKIKPEVSTDVIFISENLLKDVGFIIEPSHNSEIEKDVLQVILFKEAQFNASVELSNIVDTKENREKLYSVEKK